MPSEDIVISARNLGKAYRLFGHPGDRVKQFFSLGLKQYHREFTALKDVSFDIRRGETVGIIGRNGSGKSTLLQLVCGILKPTSGSIAVNGRVSALLELGAGFNPEFTGRENVYFQGAIMGLGKVEMDARFDDIAAFAEIGEFIDQPVRTYSSGMFVRLAFAAAVCVDPEILAVDEALAVGDVGFRARCFRRIGELRSKGCAILFVSHAMDQIARLCDRAILLDAGVQLMTDRPLPVVERYRRLLGDEPGVQGCLDVEEDRPSPSEAMAYETNGAVIESVRLTDEAGEPAGRLLCGRRYRCAFSVRFTRDASNVRYALLIRTRDAELGGSYSAPTRSEGIHRIASGTLAGAEFEFECTLNPGRYYLNVAVFGSEAEVEYALHGIQNALAFQVQDVSGHATIGPVNFDYHCRPLPQLPREMQ